MSRHRARPPAAALVLALATAAAGCSPLAHTVANRAVRHLPPEKQLRLFDAENDVSIALDERAQMVEMSAGLERAHHRAERAAAHGPAALGAAMRARQSYLSAAGAFLTARIRVQNKVVVAALAKFELAKAILVKKNNLDGAQDLRIPEFERQASAESAAAKRQLGDIAALRERAVKQRVAWETARGGVAANSLGGASSLVDEEDPQWEIW